MSSRGRPQVGGRTYLVSSVDHALRLLAAFQDHPSLAVRESAELLGVAPSTAHRLLTTMQASGFVVQDPASRRYSAGPALVAVALASLQRIDVGRVARPHLAALAAETRETVSLAVPEGATIRFIDSVEGPDVVRVRSRTGLSVPAHTSAAGKALLAGLGREELLRLYPTTRLQRRTPRSIGSRASLLQELEDVRRLGYATSLEESSAGLASVAVGIGDVRGRVIAALAVLVPAERLDSRRTGRIVHAALGRAKRIEAELGSVRDGARQSERS
ncbi:MAG TPA: IclR family transcriptional regulator [Acidimicrobiales bacterium]|nr:IclR family transcriptional regulator [Acidimicrobiales bacterium]